MSFWKTLGKIAIPVGAAALAPFTGGSSLALMGLGAGAGAAEGAIDHGLKGALTGAALGGLTGGAGSKIAGLMGLGKGAATAASAGLGGAANDFMGPTLEQANPDFVGPTFEQAGRASSGPSGGNLFSNLVKGFANGGSNPTTTQNMADLGSVIGNFGQAESTNRFVKAGLTQNYDQLVANDAAANRAQESDALKKLAQTKYLLNGGAQPINHVVNSGAIPNFGFEPTAASDAQKIGAQTLQDQLLKRLTPEGAIKPTDPNTYLKPGKAEEISKWGSLASSGLGTIFNMMNQQKSNPAMYNT